MNINYTDALFMKPEFREICNTILDKASTRDSKNIVKISRFAHKCLRRHRTLIKETRADECIDNDFKLKEMFGIYYEDTKHIILNHLFIEMCEISIRRNPSTREFADLLLDVHEILSSINKGDRNDLS